MPVLAENTWCYPWEGHCQHGGLLACPCDQWLVGMLLGNIPLVVFLFVCFYSSTFEECP